MANMFLTSEFLKVLQLKSWPSLKLSYSSLVEARWLSGQWTVLASSDPLSSTGTVQDPHQETTLLTHISACKHSWINSSSTRAAWYVCGVCSKSRRLYRCQYSSGYWKQSPSHARTLTAAEYSINKSRDKLAHIIGFYCVPWPWSSSELYVFVNVARL